MVHRPFRGVPVPASQSDAADQAPSEIGALLGRGRVADVHAFGAHALKLYHPGRGKTEAFGEAAILSLLEVHRLPAPRVHAVGDYGGRWGLVMDRIDGRTLGDQALGDPARVAPCLDEMVRLQLLVHATVETRLRPLKARLADNIGRAPGLDSELRNRLLGRLATLPDGARLCHGDFHPFNIVAEGDRATIVDWLDATAGPPATDACRSYLLLTQGAPELADPYLDRYATRSGIARADILAWLPLLAAARLNEGIAEEAQTLLALAGAGS